MFVFTSLCAIGTWFIVRLVYDLAFPAHRSDLRWAPRRFRIITVLGALLAGGMIGGAVAAAFDAEPGFITGVVVAVGYVLLIAALRRLLDAWQVNE